MKVEVERLGLYKGPMRKPKRSALVGAMVSDETKKELEDIGSIHDRSLSYVAYVMMMRGLSAYKKDGNLTVDTTPNSDDNHAQATTLSSFDDVDRVRAKSTAKKAKGRK